MIKLSDILRESLDLGTRKTDPDTGVSTTLTSQDPETGKLTWDVDNSIDLKFVHKKIADLVDYMNKAEKGSKEEQILEILKSLRLKVARLY